MAEESAGYTINVESETIVVRHTGKLSVQAIEGSRREVAALATARHLKGILLDVSQATWLLTTVDIFELAASQVDVLPPGTGTAVVIRPGQLPAEDVQFGETVSLNRGVAARAFVDRDAARRWLSGRARSGSFASS